MKGGRPAVVPLSAQASAILEARRDEAGPSDFVFPGRTWEKPFAGWRKGAPRLIALLRSQIPEAEHFVVHDIRRSVATALVENVEADELLVGRILQHSMKSALGVTAVYQKSKRVKAQYEALQAWADLLLARANEKAPMLEAAE